MVLLRYFDVAVILVAAPIMILIGVPAAGYLIAAGAWVALRAVGVAVEHIADRVDARTQVSLRLAYMLSRLFLLALVVILVRESEGKNAGITALAVIVFAFTMQLATSAASHPRSK